MSRGERKTVRQRDHRKFSLNHQCRLLSTNWPSLYYVPRQESPETLALMQRIDVLSP
ncbi:hypothetical protein N9F34_01215 [Alphaproteobacteria bacterium]|nr:hypothetical protein [Alphaproteobacteria bacterium]